MDLIPLFIQLSRIHDCREAITRFVKNHSIDFGYAEKVCNALLDNQDRMEREAKERQMRKEEQIMLQNQK